MMNYSCKTIFALLLFISFSQNAFATKLMEVRPVDDEYLMVFWRDGYIEYKDDGKDEGAFTNACTKSTTAKPYGTALDVNSAKTAKTYTITSDDDNSYGSSEKNPVSVYRRAKVNGVTGGQQYFLDHWVFLKLPSKMKQGKKYTLKINSSTKSDLTEKTFTYDVFNQSSEAIHLNIIGYYPSQVKSADLYMWLGDGGARDYQTYEGKKVILYNVNTHSKDTVGSVKFWKSAGKDVGNYDLLKSAVWNCDFSSFTGTGTFRLVVENVGCSPEFKIGNDAYYEPYKTAIRGYFYMRIGQDSVKIRPVPRRPLWIPKKDPPDYKVYMTTLIPNSEQWKTDKAHWDSRDWSKYKKPGSPTHPDAWGGWSDAMDWDRQMTHTSGVWDILLPYILSNGAMPEDNLQIAESGNGVPDCIDEARYEVDFFLRLRDGAGYCFGINNPSGTVGYMTGAGTIMAWVSAANSAMIAESYRIAGKTDLMNRYRDSAIVAFNYAQSKSDQELDYAMGIGDGKITGRNMKMMAAAYLYSVTGKTSWEDIMKDNCTITSSTSNVETSSMNQLWGIAAYLKTKRDIHYKSLQDNMRASVINEAKKKNTDLIESRPSRRSTENRYWQAAQAVQRVCVAHAVTTSQTDKDLFMKAMIYEADYGLGRNTMNMVQMTGLGSRHVEDIFTTGQNDGTPGVHPGHTPYMNPDDWGGDWWGGKPSFMHSRGYPAWSDWPRGEALWRVRYCYANNEFQPQQTMRGKTCLLGYLYSLKKDFPNEIEKEWKKSTKSSANLPHGIFSDAFRVFDMRGRVVAEYSRPSDARFVVSKSGATRLEGTHLSKNIYIVQVANKNGNRYNFRTAVTGF